MRLKFWQWAHGATERLWHWIYYNRLPDGIAEKDRAAAAKGSVYSYKYEFVNSKSRQL